MSTPRVGFLGLGTMGTPMAANLLKAGFPLFAFDPNQRNRYFDLLEKGRAIDAEDFVRFCLREHNRLLRQLREGR